MTAQTSHPDGLPVLGLTARQYAAACVGAQMPGAANFALRRYSKLFREGDLRQPLLEVPVPEVQRRITSDCAEGTTLKFTQHVAGRLEKDGTVGPPLETESVLIPMVGRKGYQTFSLCVSSQVGCAMGCGFCQTAQMGLIRSLRAEEIVAQWFAARHLLGHHVSNIVFMGMGEPLDNFEAVVAAIAVLTDHRGPAIPMNKITVSTVGRIDGIRRLAEQVHQPGWHRLGLAVSLNAPNDEIRSQIMPINKAMPMAELRRELEAWPRYGGFKFCFEYVLIPGLNDQRTHAEQLAAYVRDLPGVVNVIPYNPREDSPWEAPREERVIDFLNWLTDAGVFAKRRRTKGRDTMAACGQLGNPALRRKPVRAGLAITAGREQA